MILPIPVHRATFFAWVLWGLGLCACRADRPAPDPHAPAAPVRAESSERFVPAEWVVIGDQIAIWDPHENELQIPRLRVGEDGKVLLPRLGSVLVAGLTAEQVESVLAERYAPYFEDLDIDVRIVELGPRYVVRGEVERPGAHEYSDDLTLFEAVMSAAPKSGSANLGRVRLIRADPRDPFQRVIDVQGMIESGDSSNNVHVLEGDVIEVPTVQDPDPSTPR